MTTAPHSANPLRALWAAGETAFGLWASLPSAFGVELLARAGASYVCVDLQHGLTSFDGLPSQLQAISGAGSAPLVRVAANDAWQIGKALDLGALGVLVPLVETGEQAAGAVAACRYPPAGVRSYGPVRAAAAIGSDEPAVLAREALCFVMVETRRGLENLEAIARTPGLDGIYVGPADLAVSLGVSPGARASSREHAEAIAAVRDACATQGLVAGMHCDSGEAAARYAAEGFRLVTVATDSALLAAAATAELEVARTSSRGAAPAPQTGAGS